MNKRETTVAIDPQFPNRWSPRAFSPTPVPQTTLDGLFEAARWAPSCFNEQPWRFYYSASGEALEALRDTLNPGNSWAREAPVLAFITARRSFSLNGKENPWARFDAGAAWMALALQAKHAGLCTHAMAGINRDAVYDVLGLDPASEDLICAVAIGYQGDAATLPEALQAREQPNDRRPLSGSVTRL